VSCVVVVGMRLLVGLEVCAVVMLHGGSRTHTTAAAKLRCAGYIGNRKTLQRQFSSKF
jgi:hypothetical protein